MRVVFLILAVLVVYAASFAGYVTGYLDYRDSVPVPVVETPKLAHHVVYFWVCDKLIGVLLTTEPFIWSDAKDGLPPDDVVDLMVEADLAGRLIAIKHWHRDCPKLEMAPKELM